MSAYRGATTVPFPELESVRRLRESRGDLAGTGEGFSQNTISPTAKQLKTGGPGSGPRKSNGGEKLSALDRAMFQGFDESREGGPGSGPRKGISGSVYSRIGPYKIVEGAGPHAGKWAAVGRGEHTVYNNKEDAIEHAKNSQRDSWRESQEGGPGSGPHKASGRQPKEIQKDMAKAMVSLERHRDTKSNSHPDVVKANKRVNALASELKAAFKQRQRSSGSNLGLSPYSYKSGGGGY